MHDASLNLFLTQTLNIPDNVSFVFKRTECSVCAASDSSRLHSAIFTDKVDSTAVQCIVRCDSGVITGRKYLLEIQFYVCAITSRGENFYIIKF